MPGTRDTEGITYTRSRYRLWRGNADKKHIRKVLSESGKGFQRCKKGGRANGRAKEVTECGR